MNELLGYQKEQNQKYNITATIQTADKPLKVSFESEVDSIENITNSDDISFNIKPDTWHKGG